MIGVEHDTMDPTYLRQMASLPGSGESWHCPDGSHIAMLGHLETNFEGLVSLLHCHA